MRMTGKKTKSKINRYNDEPVSGHTLKSSAKKERILADARSVFTRHPYHKASLRLICEQTGINHNLIRYHFGSKENLFDALVSQLISEWETGITEFMAGTANNKSKEHFPRFIEAFLAFGFAYPDGMKIIMQNTGERGSGSIHPGSALLMALTDNVQTSIINNYSLKSTEKDLSMWVAGFVMAIVCVLGAEDSLRVVSGFENDREHFRQHTEYFLTSSFYPTFQYLLTGKVANVFDDIRIKPTKPGVFDILVSGLTKNSDSPPVSKGEITRGKILSAARVVFSKNSYEVGTIRMIGNEGNLDFTLVRHYFVSKEILFNAVVEDLFNEFTREILLIYEGLDKMDSAMESHRLSSKRLIDHCFTSADALAVIMQNAARVGEMGLSLPGRDYIMKFITTTESIVHQLETLKAPEIEIMNFILLKSLILINGIGAASFYSGFQTMVPDGDDYHAWIYDLYNFLIYPVYSNLIHKYGTDE